MSALATFGAILQNPDRFRRSVQPEPVENMEALQEALEQARKDSADVKAACRVFVSGRVFEDFRTVEERQA